MTPFGEVRSMLQDPSQVDRTIPRPDVWDPAMAHYIWAHCKGDLTLDHQVEYAAEVQLLRAPWVSVHRIPEEDWYDLLGPTYVRLVMPMITHAIPGEAEMLRRVCTLLSAGEYLEAYLTASGPLRLQQDQIAGAILTVLGELESRCLPNMTPMWHLKPLVWAAAGLKICMSPEAVRDWRIRKRFQESTKVELFARLLGQIEVPEQPELIFSRKKLFNDF